MEERRLNIDWLRLLILVYPGFRGNTAVGPASPFLLGRLQLVVVHEQKLVLADLIAAALIVGLYWLSRGHIDELLPNTVPGLLIDLPKRNALARGYSRIQGDGTGNEGELQKALPVRTRYHVVTPYTSDASEDNASNGCSFSRLECHGYSEHEKSVLVPSPFSASPPVRMVDITVVPQCSILRRPERFTGSRPLSSILTRIFVARPLSTIAQKALPIRPVFS